MMTFYVNNKGFEVSERWVSGCWVSVENPTAEERNYLLDGLGVPESFLSDVEDTDERARREEDEGWQLFVIRAPWR